MGLPRHRRRASWSSTTLLVSVVALCLLFFVTSSSATQDREKIHGGRNEMARHHGRRGGDHCPRHGWASDGLLWMRMTGPGSSPPTCRSKCGRCAPCRPVHVPIHPGRVTVPLEYYPEAWRCKCGDTLFMP